MPPCDSDCTRILVVDDDPLNLQVVVNYMALEKISVRTCTSGPEALSEIERNINKT